MEREQLLPLLLLLVMKGASLCLLPIRIIGIKLTVALYPSPIKLVLNLFGKLFFKHLNSHLLPALLVFWIGLTVIRPVENGGT
jgi:hypothetical protein